MDAKSDIFFFLVSSLRTVDTLVDQGLLQRIARRKQANKQTDKHAIARMVFAQVEVFFFVKSEYVFGNMLKMQKGEEGANSMKMVQGICGGRS